MGMIDTIVRIDNNGNPIYRSDIEWWQDFIGFQKLNGEIVFFYPELEG